MATGGATRRAFISGMSDVMTAEQWLKQIPELPAELELAGQHYIVHRVLRHLPGRRIALLAQTATTEVVLKLFAAEGKGEHEFERELAAHRHCDAAGIAVAPIVSHAAELAGISYISYLYIADGNTLNALPFEQQPHQALFSLFAACHNANCYQQDPHLDNFIYDGKTLYLLDLASVDCRDKAMGLSLCLDNLARLIGQWPVEREATLLLALNRYFEQRDIHLDVATQQMLGQKLVRARADRQRHYLKKQLRPCTMTHYQRSLTLEAAWRKNVSPALTKSPLQAMQKAVAVGQPLKNGNTATVVRSKLAGEKVVIKRYNIKNIRHFISRCWRPSRASHSWMMANLLEYLGISTPQPLGFIEKRVLGLRSTAYFICRHIPGRTLLELKDKELLQPALLEQLATLFTQLRLHQIYHGDLKATNFIVDARGKLWLIDLDAMKQYTGSQFNALHQADQQRFLRNWSTHKHHQLLLDTIQAGTSNQGVQHSA